MPEEPCRSGGKGCQPGLKHCPTGNRGTLNPGRGSEPPGELSGNIETSAHLRRCDSVSEGRTAVATLLVKRPTGVWAAPQS